MKYTAEEIAARIYADAQEVFGHLCSKKQVQFSFDSFPFTNGSMQAEVRMELGL